jgi:hypothetical protein
MVAARNIQEINVKTLKRIYREVLAHLAELAASNRALAAELAFQRADLHGIHEAVDFLAASEREQRARSGHPLDHYKG